MKKVLVRGTTTRGRMVGKGCWEGRKNFSLFRASSSSSSSSSPSCGIRRIATSAAVVPSSPAGHPCTYGVSSHRMTVTTATAVASVAPGHVSFGCWGAGGEFFRQNRSSPRSTRCVTGKATGAVGGAGAGAGGPPLTFDAVGFGQAMVDYAGYVSDEFLQDVLGELNKENNSGDKHAYKKGDRVIVSVDQLGSVLNKLDSTDFKVTTGGSLSNTLVALSRLGGAGVRQHTHTAATENEKTTTTTTTTTAGKKENASVNRASRASASPRGSGSVLKVGMAGLVGSDPVGSFYRAKMDRAGVEFLSEPAHSTTGTVIVLTTPDAQRTMLSHFPAQTGSESSCMLTPQVVNSIVSSRVLLVEGYLWECGSTVITSLMEAMRVAQENGTLVCMTLSDTSVVNKHYDSLWEALRKRRLVDIVFANALEAQALTEASTPKSAALALAQHTRVVSCVTDGHRGSHLAGMGACQMVPPYWMPKGPLDTCGAGDAYAAGALYGLLRGASIRGMGYSGARVSSTVISQRGARLKTEDADKLVEVLPMMMYETTKLVIPQQEQEQKQEQKHPQAVQQVERTKAKAEFESF